MFTHFENRANESHRLLRDDVNILNRLYMFFFNDIARFAHDILIISKIGQKTRLDLLKTNSIKIEFIPFDSQSDKFNITKS